MKGEEMKKTIEAIKDAIDSIIDESTDDIIQAMEFARADAEEGAAAKVAAKASITITSLGLENEVAINLGFVKERASRKMTFRVSQQEELFPKAKKGGRERNPDGTFKGEK